MIVPDISDLIAEGFITKTRSHNTVIHLHYQLMKSNSTLAKFLVNSLNILLGKFSCYEIRISILERRARYNAEQLSGSGLPVGSPLTMNVVLEL